MATTNTNFKVKNGLDAGGDISTPGKLYINAASGDEGGEIFLNKPVTNTSISGGVNIDVYQNKLRFWESGGSARGYYIDLTAGGAGVSTSLTGGSTGAMNYAQTEGTKQSAISSAGTTIVSVSITTNGYPVLVQVTGDVENNSTGGWTVLQLYRGSTAIGNPVHTEGSAASENVPYALSVIDAPTAGTYTYALKLNNSAGGTFNFGESDGPVITAIELSGPKGDTGTAGATGADGNSPNAFTTISTPSGTSPVADSTSDTLTLAAGTGLTITGDATADSVTISVNPGGMLNQIVDGTSGNSYGLVGTSAYLDVKDTNGYNKEIELDITAVETKLITDGFATTTDLSSYLTTSAASSTYLTQSSASSTYLTQSNASSTYLTSSTATSTYAALAGAAFTGTVTVPTPVNATEAATKAYVDNVASGINVHPSVKYATTGALGTAGNLVGGTITTTYANGTSGEGATLTIATSSNWTAITIDGQSLTVSDRVLIKNQGGTSSSLQNGIYTVTQVGAVGNTTSFIFTRAIDNDQTPEINAGDLTYVATGTTHAGDGFVQTAIISAVGTTPVAWTQYSGAGAVPYASTSTAGIASFDSTQFTVDGVGKATVNALSGTLISSGLVTGQYGGTGVANTGKTITVSGNTSIGSSTHTVAFATSGNTSVTLPTTGTLATTNTINGVSFTGASAVKVPPVYNFTAAGGGTQTTSWMIALSGTTAPTARPDGTAIAAGDIWVSF